MTSGNRVALAAALSAAGGRVDADHVDPDALRAAVEKRAQRRARGTRAVAGALPGAPAFREGDMMRQTNLILAATLAAGLPAGTLHADPIDGHYGHMGGLGLGLGFGMMILFWGALIVGAVFLVRWISEQAQTRPRKSDALETLKLRLAKGEIDIEDYEARRKVLEGDA